MNEKKLFLVWKKLEIESKAQAIKNIEKWGIQDIRTLLLVATEELGELTQAVLQFYSEDGKIERIGEELIDLMAVMYAFATSVDDLMAAVLDDEEKEEGASS